MLKSIVFVIAFMSINSFAQVEERDIPTPKTAECKLKISKGKKHFKNLKVLKLKNIEELSNCTDLTRVDLDGKAYEFAVAIAMDDECPKKNKYCRSGVVLRVDGGVAAVAYANESKKVGVINQAKFSCLLK